MKYLKKYKIFENSEDISDFKSVVKDKLLELSDKDFKVKIEDGSDEPLLEDMIRVIVKKDTNFGSRYRSSFLFSDVSDVLEDVLFTNKVMGNLYEHVHVIITLEISNPFRNERLSYVFDKNDSCIWSFERKDIKLNPLDLNLRCVELYFE